MSDKFPLIPEIDDFLDIELPEQFPVNPVGLFETLSVDVTDFSFLQKGTHCGK